MSLWYVVWCCIQDKDVAHLWELGGGTWLSKLADLIITANALQSVDEACVVILLVTAISLAVAP